MTDSFEVSDILGTSSHSRQSFRMHPTDANIILLSIGPILVLQDLDSPPTKEYLCFHDSTVTNAIISPDGRLCISGQIGSERIPGAPAPVTIWDLPHRESLFTLRGLAGSILSLSISRDSRLIVVCGENCITMLVDCESGETVYSRRTEGVCSICLFVDPPEQSFDYCFITIQESVVYMNSVNFDLSLMNFAVSTLRISPTNCPYRKPLDALACDGKLFLSSMTGDLCVFDLLSRSFIGCFTVTNEAVRLLSLIDDTSISVTTASAKIMLVDLKENFRIISTLAENITVTSMEYSRLRQSVFVQTPDGLIVSVPLDGQEVKIHSHFASAKVTSFACRMDGTIAFASTKGVSLWNLSELKHTKSVHVPKASVSCLAVGSDCRILCGFESGALRVYTIDLELEYEIIACHRGSVSGSAGCSDYVATGGSDGIIRIWKYVSNIMEFTQFASSRIGGIEVCNGTDNRILGVWNEKREIVYIDLKSKKIARKFTTNKLGNITGMAQMLFRKMDWVLVTSHIAGYVAVWDIDYPEPIACVNVRKLPLTSLAVVEERVLCGTAQGELVQVTNLSQDTTEVKVKSNPLTPDPIIKVCVSASTVVLLNAQGLIMTTKL